jgi:glycerol-3-phosphate dehydrogenase
MHPMETLASTSRARHLAEMAQSPVDVLVIGGGITGAGVALDAVTRGYRVALVEKHDFASGTSSKSTKLAHGGIRYLPNFDFPLVYEALHERDVLFRIAPHLVHPLPFVLPIYSGDRHPIGIPFTTPGGIGLRSLIDTGLWMYDLMAGRRNVPHHKRLSLAQVAEYAPTLIQDGLEPSFAYYDGQTDDARLTLAVLATAAKGGALIANHAEVIGLIEDDKTVTGTRIRDHLTGDEFTVQARYVVNAGGIFSERIAALGEESLPVHVLPSKGVHLVFDRA